jgi:hypothetical protein
MQLFRHVLIAAFLVPLAACTEVTETSSVEQHVEVPDVEPWVHGQGNPKVLFPETAEHLHTAMIPADERTIYAWGISSGEVLWIYRVDDKDTDDLAAALTTAWKESEVPGSGRSHSVAGVVKPKGDPGDPGPPGEPFSAEYIRIVLVSAQQHQDATQAMLADLNEL